MLKVLQNPQLTEDEVGALRPLYNQLPASACAWVDERTNGAFNMTVAEKIIFFGSFCTTAACILCCMLHK
jgi:hypothetical protein